MHIDNVKKERKENDNDVVHISTMAQYKPLFALSKKSIINKNGVVVGIEGRQEESFGERGGDFEMHPEVYVVLGREATLVKRD